VWVHTNLVLTLIIEQISAKIATATEDWRLEEHYPSNWNCAGLSEMENERLDSQY
jgi:hypothetical protein